jgi:hypothetical protein
VAEPIDWFELELRIILLSPISRAAHLGGPAIHARRLVQIWRDTEMTDHEIDEVSDDELIARRMVIDDDGSEAKAIDAELGTRTRAVNSVALDSAFEPPERPQPSDCFDRWGGNDIPLSQAFRLLPVALVARAIDRTAYMSDHDYPNDPVHWPLPPLNDLLPELHDLVWQGLLNGKLRVEAIRYARGKIGKTARPVPPIELQRLSPDWRLSRLCRGDHDEFVEARVRWEPVEPVEPVARKRVFKADLEAAILEIARGYPLGVRPPFKKIKAELEAHFGSEMTRQQVRDALKKAPQLRRERGRPKSPT